MCRGFAQDPASGRSVRDILCGQYVASSAAGGMQAKEGQAGHGRAVMSHKISAKEHVQLKTGAGGGAGQDAAAALGMWPRCSSVQCRA